jgi:putative transposase
MSMTTQENSAEMSLEPTARSVPLVAGDTPAMWEWAEQLVARARAEGVELTGDDGLLTAMIRQALQTGLKVELADHLGYEPYDPAGRGSGNSRNGSSAKAVTTDVGEVALRVPRDRNGTCGGPQGAHGALPSAVV